MRLVAAICAGLVLCGVALSRDQRQGPPLPERFVIGRHTFFDFGPPFDYYELLFAGPAEKGASVERITLTPAGDMCTMPARVEVASAAIEQSVAMLLGGTNPCTIPEKELNRELKRRKHFLVFSGANVAMQVRCGVQTRIIRSDILDRDLFDAHLNTPKDTSWTMRLLDQLDHALGPGVMDKRMFSMPGDNGAQTQGLDSPVLQDIASGKYDALFRGGRDKASDVFRSSQKPPPPPPSVTLRNSTPFQPSVAAMPAYPAIARAARIEGLLTFTTDVDSTGKLNHLVFDNTSSAADHFLRPAVENAVTGWTYPEEAFNHQVRVTLDFALNCHNQPK
jgi:hypothetical protein